MSNGGQNLKVLSGGNAHNPHVKNGSEGYDQGRAEPYTGQVPAERKAKNRNAAKAAKKARRAGRKK